MIATAIGDFDLPVLPVRTPPLQGNSLNKLNAK
jgi:hypothetical protein